MEVDMNAMKAEIGGAFVVSWLVLAQAGGLGLDTLQGAVALAAVWMTFGGAHVLPVVTWCHMMTGDLGDVEGNWAANGMRLLAQAVGALLAIMMVTEVGANSPDPAWSAATFAAPKAWAAITTVAAGAIWWTIHTRSDSVWVSAFGLMVVGGAMALDGGHQMGASLASSADGIVDVAMSWIVDGAMVGVGALLANTIDDNVN
jgi:hypothetical protein